MDMPPSGWYPDPYGVPGLLRWWDGSGWTEHTRAFEAAARAAAERGGAGPRSPEAATSLDMPPVAAARQASLPPATSLDLPPVRGDSTRLDLPATFDAPGQATRAFSRDEYLGYAHAMGQRRRRRGWVMALLSFGTVAILGVMTLVLLRFVQQHPPNQPVALDTTPAVQHTTAPPASPSPTASPAGSTVTDGAAGLSYTLLDPPWQAGCPQGLNQTFAWTSGESAVAGPVTIQGQQTNWYGNACSGPLPAQFGYNGVQDLLNTTQNLVNTFENAYYNGVQHTASQIVSTPHNVSGHTGWEIRFLMTYPAGANPGMTWTSELGAVVVEDRGTGVAPAVFYVSMPSNLDENNVDKLVNSLQIPASIASPPAATGSPAGGNNPLRVHGKAEVHAAVAGVQPA